MVIFEDISRFSCVVQGEYESLAKKLSEYVVKLLDHVRGNDELDVILNEEVEGHGQECHGKLARLKLAIKCNEKQVSDTQLVIITRGSELSALIPKFSYRRRKKSGMKTEVSVSTEPSVADGISVSHEHFCIN